MPSGPICACRKRCDPRNVRPFTARSVLGGFKLVLTNRIALCYTLATTFIFGSLFGFINSAQQIYVGIYDLGVYFPFAFAGVAVFMSIASFLNSRLVGKFGMRRLSHGSLLGFVAVNTIWMIVQVAGPQPMPFFAFHLLLRHCDVPVRLDRLELQLAGDGTARPCRGDRVLRSRLHEHGRRRNHRRTASARPSTARPCRWSSGYFVVSIIGLIFVLIAEKGRLFQPHNPPSEAGRLFTMTGF